VNLTYWGRLRLPQLQARCGSAIERAASLRIVDVDGAGVRSAPEFLEVGKRQSQRIGWRNRLSRSYRRAGSPCAGSWASAGWTDPGGIGGTLGP